MQNNIDLTKKEIELSVRAKLKKIGLVHKIIKMVISLSIISLGVITTLFSEWGPHYQYVLTDYEKLSGATRNESYAFTSIQNSIADASTNTRRLGAYLSESAEAFFVVFGILLILAGTLLLVKCIFERTTIDRQLVADIVDEKYEKLLTLNNSNIEDEQVVGEDFNSKFNEQILSKS